MIGWKLIVVIVRIVCPFQNAFSRLIRLLWLKDSRTYKASISSKVSWNHNLVSLEKRPKIKTTAWEKSTWTNVSKKGQVEKPFWNISTWQKENNQPLKDDFSNAASMNSTPLTQCYPFLEKHFVKKRNQIFLEHQYLATSRSKFPLELIDIGGRHWPPRVLCHQGGT